MGTSDEQRAREWARQLGVLSRAEGVLVLDGGTVWRVMPGDLTSLELIEGIWRRAGFPVREDSTSLAQLRKAISVIDRARSLRALARQGHAPLRVWRDTDIPALLANARSYERRLDWAIRHADPDPTIDQVSARPLGVLTFDPVNPEPTRRDPPAGTRFPDPDDAWSRLVDNVLAGQRGEATGSAGGQAGLADPLGPARVLAACITAGVPLPPSAGRVTFSRASQSALVADRILDVHGPEIARRWIANVAARWWPSAAVRQQLTVLAESASGPGTDAIATAVEATVELLRDTLTAEQIGHLRADATSPGRFREALTRTLNGLREDWGFEWGRDAAAGLLDLLVLLPHDHTPDLLPLLLSSYNLYEAARGFATATPAWRELAGPLFLEHMAAGAYPGSWVESISPTLAVSTLEHWPIGQPVHGWNPRRLGRYLTLLDSVTDDQQREWLRSYWVLSLVNSEYADSAFALLIAANHLEPESVQAAAALAGLVGAASKPVGRLLDAWSRPELESSPTDVDPVARELGIEPQLLIDYLAYRRLAGDGEQLPSDVLALLDAERDRENQVERLEFLLADPQIPHERAQVLDGERRRLLDPAVVEGRRQAATVRARNQLATATTQYRIAALRNLLEAAASEALDAIPDHLDLGVLASVVELINDYEIDPGLVRRFLATALSSGSTRDWPENQAWMERRREDFAVDTWVAGFRTERAIDGEQLTYYTETDLLQALRMGSWFNTCLSLEDGGNRVSALTNVIEANRHIVYATDRHGTIAARKLIGVTATGELLGYRTYAHEHRQEHKATLDSLIEDFARSCGLTLAETGEPESLTGAWWYDDGVEPWSPLPSTAEATQTDAEPELSEVGEPNEDTRHGPELLRRWRPETRSPLVERWVDGRVPEKQRSLRRAVAAGDDCESIAAIPLIDPAVFSTFANSWREERVETRHLRLPVGVDAIEAALHLSSTIDPSLVVLVPPDVAARYFADHAHVVPHPIHLRVLRHRGLRAHRLATTVEHLLARLHAENEAPRIPDAMGLALTLAAADDRTLRAALQRRDHASAAATELALRGDRHRASAVSAAAQRWPDLPGLWAAAAVLAEPPSTPFPFRVGEKGVRWDLLPPLGFLRAAKPDALALHLSRQEDKWGGPEYFAHWALALLGHHDFPPEPPYESPSRPPTATTGIPDRVETRIQSTWHATQALDAIVREGDVVDWQALGQIAYKLPGLLDDPRVQDRVLRSLATQNDEFSDACQVMLSATRGSVMRANHLYRSLTASTSTTTTNCVAFSFLASTPARRDAQLRRSVAVVMDLAKRKGALREPSKDPLADSLADSLAITLASDLPPSDHLAVLAKGPDIDARTYRSVMAARVVEDPRLLDHVTEMPAHGCAQLLDGLCRALPGPAAEQAVTQALRARDPSTAFDILEHLLAPLKIEWHSGAQRAVARWCHQFDDPLGGQTVEHLLDQAEAEVARHQNLRTENSSWYSETELEALTYRIRWLRTQL